MTERPTAYIETTIASYLTARRSRDPSIAASQDLTARWWKAAATRFDRLISQVVLDEASMGDPDAAAARLRELANCELLEGGTEISRLAADYVALLALPPRARADAVHLAYAVAFGVDYLVTWNMRHLANSLTMRRVVEFNLGRSLPIPLIVTPDYLLKLDEPETP